MQLISFCMKKRVCFVILGGISACLLLMHMMSAAYSSTISGASKARADTLSSYNGQPAGSLPLVIPAQGSIQQNNQSFHGISNSANHSLLVGRNEGNSGNQGVNGGFAQDNAADSGNQVSGQRKTIGVQQNNQLIAGNGSGSNSGNSATNIGFNQGNSGNEGINLGHNQDNAGNSGNQVNNQANVIGTQINKQGTTVNNDHNVIEHQINYVTLLPNVGLYLSMRPKLEFAISVGK